MRKLLGFVLILGVGACQDITHPLTDADGAVGPAQYAPGTGLAASASPRAIPGRFIVTLTEKTRADDIVREYGITPDFVYSAVLNGFAGSISEAARSGLLKDMRVARVEPDEMVFTAGGVQPNATWGLDRIDQRGLPLDASYAYDYAGAGVTAYIVDTGIRYTHQEFGGRAGPGYDAFGGDGSDCHGHGTHVAGTVGGATYGVAKQARLVSVRVLSCTGSGMSSGIIAGLDWVAANGKRPAVVNMSLGGAANTSTDAAVQRLVSAGVTVVVAAGNSATDACTISPARAPEAITVGATDRNDARASFSNFGSCLDIFAPGVSITAASYSGDNTFTGKSGTSMASPHVAGVVALYLEENPAAPPATVTSALMSRATQGIVAGANSASNHLVYARGGGAPVPPPVNAAPSASFVFTCTDLSCTFTDRSSDSDGSIVSRSWNFGDGATSTATNPSRTFAAAGTYRVTLTVTDNAGAKSSSSKDVTVTAPAPNAPPVAAFTASCTDLACTFADLSSDADGSITQRTWTFGDGTTSSFSSSATSASHTYSSAGTYQVRLTVTDDRGGVASATQSVSVNGLALSAAGYKDKGRHRVDLAWSGAAGTSVDVMLNGKQQARVPNNGAYTYATDTKGGATYNFRICEIGTGRCSAEVSVRL